MSMQQREPHPLEIKENFTKSVIEVQASMQFMYNMLLNKQQIIQQMQAQISKQQSELDKYKPKTKTPDHAGGQEKPKIIVDTKNKKK